MSDVQPVSEAKYFPQNPALAQDKAVSGIEQYLQPSAPLQIADVPGRSTLSSGLQLPSQLGLGDARRSILPPPGSETLKSFGNWGYRTTISGERHETFSTEHCRQPWSNSTDDGKGGIAWLFPPFWIYLGPAWLYDEVVNWYRDGLEEDCRLEKATSTRELLAAQGDAFVLGQNKEYNISITVGEMRHRGFEVSVTDGDYLILKDAAGQWVRDPWDKVDDLMSVKFRAIRVPELRDEMRQAGDDFVVVLRNGSDFLDGKAVTVGELGAAGYSFSIDDDMEPVLVGPTGSTLKGWKAVNSVVFELHRELRGKPNADYFARKLVDGTLDSAEVNACPLIPNNGVLEQADCPDVVTVEEMRRLDWVREISVGEDGLQLYFNSSTDNNLDLAVERALETRAAQNP